MYTYNKHTVKPKISLKSGDVTYGYSRKGANGSIDTTLKLGENVVVEWTDNSSSGAWKTTVDMPLEDSKKTKVRRSLFPPADAAVADGCHTD